MTSWIISNKTRGIILSDNALYADTFSKRFRGLLGRKTFDQGEGLILPGCASIHMFGMRFAIDLIFLNRGSLVRKMVCGLKPNRFTFGGIGSTTAIEFPAGTLEDSGTRTGDEVVFHPATVEEYE